jgi:Concanavalin A-like lectin/glucanases superfamily
MPPTVYDVDNNQWHHIALVVDRTTEKMSIYVDGTERASSTKPNGYTVLAGTASTTFNHFYLGLYPTQTFDDVRISSTAHTSQQIRQGFFGGSVMRVTSQSVTEIFRNHTEIIPTNNDLTVNGYNLEGASIQVEKDGQPIAVNPLITGNSYRQIQLRLEVAPNVQLGIADIVISKLNQPTQTVKVRIVETFALPVEPDTLLLWHLDETSNGGIQVQDAGTLGLNGTASSNSTAVNGRFAGGRSSSSTSQNVNTASPANAFRFGGGSFTMETWIKTGQLSANRNIFYLYNFSGYGGSYPMYLNLNASGELLAETRSDSGVNWTTVMPPTVYDVDNNQWHHIALVVDRTTEKMSIYVDGTERASSTKPNGYTVLAGTASTTFNHFYLELNPNQSLDDVRISSIALSPERIAQSVFSSDTVQIYRATPSVVQKGLQNVPVTLTGMALDRVTVSTGSSEITASIISSSLTQLNLAISSTATAPVGSFTLILQDQNGNLTNVQLNLVNQQAFAPTVPGTVLLWHLDETGNGGVQVLNSGITGLNGTSSSNSTAVNGRFAGGRSSSSTSQNVNTASPANAFRFGGGSFTMETWIKTGQLSANRNIFYLYNFSGYGGNFPMFLNLNASGELSAETRSDSGVNWTTTMPPTVYDVDNNQWHHIALVVDRTTEKMSIYVDGTERASSTKPNGYTVLAGTASTTFNHFYLELNPTQTVDETRVLNLARTPQEISDTWLGTTNGFALFSPKPANPIFGKESPPKSPPNNRSDKSVPSNSVPVDTRLKRDIQKEKQQ